MVSRIHLLSLSMLGLLLSAWPAQAAKLVEWRFDQRQNQLEFSTEAQIAPAQIAQAPTQINEVRSTPDGLFVRLSGEPPRVQVKRSRDRRTIDFTIRNAALGASSIPLPSDAAKLGIQQISAEPDGSNTRIRLQVEADSPDWKPSVSNFGGIVLLPASRPEPVAGSTGNDNANSSAQVQAAGQVATLQSLSIDRSSNQLLLQVDQPARYSTREENGDYVVTLSPARLAPGATPPAVYVGDRLRRVTVSQRGPQSVEVRLTPDAGVTIGELQVPNLRLLALPLQRQRQDAGPISSSTTGSSSGITGPIQVTLPPGRPGSTSPSFPSQPVFSPDFSLPSPSRRAVVVIDPGHGGPDPGAVGNGLKETEIVLDISRQVTAFLEGQGVQVVMTRNGEYDVDLQPRVDIAERANATVFVSIHANAISLSRPEVNGFEIYHASPSGQALASAIHRSVMQGVSIGDRGVRSARFYVLRRTSMPAALVETGFITGAQDKLKLADPTFRTQMARAIARGILQYLQ